MEKEGNGEKKEGEIKGGEEASHDIPRDEGGRGAVCAHLLPLVHRWAQLQVTYKSSVLIQQDESFSSTSLTT